MTYEYSGIFTYYFGKDDHSLHEVSPGNVSPISIWFPEICVSRWSKTSDRISINQTDI